MSRAFLRAPSGLLGLGVIALLFVVALVGPLLLGVQARILDVTQASQNPNPAHLLGTDPLGRDIFIRLLVASRLSLSLALAATALGASIGIAAGATAAILPRPLRSIALRAIDTMMAFPGILIAIFIGAIVGPGAIGAALGVGIAISFAFARVASALAMSVAGREYVAAARVIGIRGPRLLWRYVLPNMAETLVITTTVAISSSIVQVSTLSFLGLGVQAPDIDWGRMLTEGVPAFYSTPAAALGPAAAIALSAIAFGFAGEALARAMNPLLWARPGTDVNHVSVASVAIFPGQGQNEPDDRPIASQGEPTVQVSDLTVSFPGRSGFMAVVDGISFSLEEGEILGIVGESGSGKTMTAMAISGLVPFPGTVTGKITIQGKDILQMSGRELARFLATRLATVFQDPLASLNPALRIGRQLTEGVEVHRGLSRRAAEELAWTRLGEVNIPTPRLQMHRYPYELSGGMRQRVMIAMGLMSDPALLIADEPTTALDVTIQAQIMDLLWRINAEHGTGIILISHNLGLVSQNCRRVLVMYAGRVVEDLTTQQLLSAPLHPYTAALIASVPDMSRPTDTPLGSIAGQAPDFTALPAGCPYHPRCPLAMDKCRVDRPPLRLRPDSRRVACWVANQDLE